MLGWAGLGAANAGAAIMVRAAANEPAMVAFEMRLLEVMERFLFPGPGDCWGIDGMVSFTAGIPGPTTAGLAARPCGDVTQARSDPLHRRGHDPVIWTMSCDQFGYLHATPSFRGMRSMNPESRDSGFA